MEQVRRGWWRLARAIARAVLWVTDRLVGRRPRPKVVSRETHVVISAGAHETLVSGDRELKRAMRQGLSARQWKKRLRDLRKAGVWID